MNKHHEELIGQFELLVGVQNELKESFNVVESTWQTNKEFPCLAAIDQWEQTVIDRIQQIAAKARTTATRMMTKNISDIRHRLDQLAVDMQQRREEGNFLDNDVIGVRNQLEQLNYTIKHINENIRINQKATNKMNWNSLIYVTANKKLSDNRFNLPELHYGLDSPQDKIWSNIRKLIRHKHTINGSSNKQSSSKRDSSLLFEPIVLTSFGSPTCSRAQKNNLSNLERTISNPFSNEDPFNYMTFTSMDQNEFFPQSSYA